MLPVGSVGGSKLALKITPPPRTINGHTLDPQEYDDVMTRATSSPFFGGLTLEQSLDLWERGEKLAAICSEWLDGARARLTTAMAAREAGDQEPEDPGKNGAAAPF